MKIKILIFLSFFSLVRIVYGEQSILDKRIQNIATNRASGYLPVSKIFSSNISEGSYQDYSMELTPGKCYSVIASGDDNIRRLSVFVFEGNNEVGLERGRSNSCVVTFCPQNNNRFRIRVMSDRGNGSFAMQVWYSNQEQNQPEQTELNDSSKQDQSQVIDNTLIQNKLQYQPIDNTSKQIQNPLSNQYQQPNWIQSNIPRSNLDIQFNQFVSLTVPGKKAASNPVKSFLTRGQKISYMLKLSANKCFVGLVFGELSVKVISFVVKDSRTNTIRGINIDNTHGTLLPRGTFVFCGQFEGDYFFDIKMSRGFGNFIFQIFEN